MADIATIGAVLTSLKAAAEIAKYLRESDLSIERAELKLKLADLVSNLAEAKIELTEVQEELTTKDRQILELEEAFQSKDSMVRNRDAYYVINANGKPSGVAYCLRCWENDHRKRQLVNDAKDFRTHVCTTCGHRYSGMSSGNINTNE